MVYSPFIPSDSCLHRLTLIFNQSGKVVGYKTQNEELKGAQKLLLIGLFAGLKTLMSQQSVPYPLLKYQSSKEV